MKKKKEKALLGIIRGTSAKMQRSGFIPLNFQRVMQSFTYITLSKVKGAMLIS